MAQPPDLVMRLAARAMARHSLVHAYGHVSLRLDDDRFMVSGPKPLGAVQIGESGVIVPVDGPFPDGVLGEVRLHRAIYTLRPDVGGICRIQPPGVMALSALNRTPRALHGLGAYFAPGLPLWPDPSLLRDDEKARRAAETLGLTRGLVLRGNGAVTVGETLPVASCHAYFLEDAAKLELALAGASSDAIALSHDEARERATGAGGLYERMWQFLTLGDPESPAQAS